MLTVGRTAEFGRDPGENRTDRLVVFVEDSSSVRTNFTPWRLFAVSCARAGAFVGLLFIGLGHESSLLCSFDSRDERVMGIASDCGSITRRSMVPRDLICDATL